MPGGYNTVVGRFDPPGDADDSATLTYTLAGPAPLLTMAADTGSVDLADLEAAGTITLQISSGTDALEQFVDLQVTGPEGLQTTLSDAAVLLPAGADKQVTLTLATTGAVGGGDLQVVASSDLGGRAVVTIGIEGNAVPISSAVQGDDIGEGASWAATFTRAGTFAYHCHPHPWMEGSVEVSPAPANYTPQTVVIEILEVDPADPDSWVFSPADATATVGDLVVWENRGVMIHNIHGGFGGSDDGHDHDHGDHHHGHGGESEGSPAAPAMVVMAALAAAVMLGRRRA